VSASSLIDWSLAVRVGRIVAGGGPETTPDFRASVWRDFTEFTARSDELVREFTGLQPAEPAPEPLVVDRPGWIKANIVSFQDVLAPLTEKLAKRTGSNVVTRRLMAGALGVQMGALLGYFSQKVLGQYDLVLGSEAGGKVYYVGPNIVEAERRFGLEPRDFRLWIAIHEVTHRTQFTAVPWLRDQMRTFMESAIGGLDLDASRLKEIAARGRELVFAGPSAWSASNVMNLLMNEEQRALLEEMQALMCVIEGHGTYVMNRIGAEQIPTFRDMKAAIESRRGGGGGPERALQKALGMDMKYEQYALGERFCNEVASLAGDDAVNRVWIGRGAFPSMAELRDPESWLKRVGA
jgi:coenzyme F420 biosynthesis associated uncharacterized protein